MRKFATVGVIATLGMSGAAFAAEGPDYSFVEAGFAHSDVQFPGENAGANGFDIGGSIELPANFFATLGFSSRSYDNDIGVDQTEISAGGGYKCSLTDSVDMFFGASLEKLTLDPDGVSSESDIGFGLNIGTRSQVTEKLELNTLVKYSSVRLSDVDLKVSGFEVSAGGRYYFSPNFAGGLDIVSDKFFAGLSQVTFVASARYSFGKLF